jgi:hypothetical protein
MAHDGISIINLNDATTILSHSNDLVRSQSLLHQALLEKLSGIRHNNTTPLILVLKIAV